MSQDKPPCFECKRYLMDEDVWGTKYHLCESKRINMITGKNIYHECWWYRYSPFCKFEKETIKITQHMATLRLYSNNK